MAHLFPRAADVSRKMLRCFFGSVLLLACTGVLADVPTYRFGVIPQRSAVLAAQYWNPILKYVGSKTGLGLELRIAKTAPEHAAMIGRGEYDLIYSNHQFKPENDGQGYRVFARPLDGDMSGQIVVLAHSPLQSLADLEGKEVVFPSEVAFVGYTVPMDALARAGVKVKPLFASNQEGAMGQLRAGRAVAAGVNSKVMQDYAKREGLGYRVLWSSESYLNIPLAAHPRVASKDLAAIQSAFVDMAADPEGQRILQASAALIRQDPPFGFVATSNRDYDNQRRVYRGALK
ncbi:MAG TPA: phosphate/phosphite/phosphonate ABC transporter substrate-binding protein [Rhodocyclaceae bacterium]|nr:phosphate/phosphite/phosphonate ABC transporter substrate-binding protein [Rhodocyclaceae bacterium]